jgi:predicted transcriptional regulator
MSGTQSCDIKSDAHRIIDSLPKDSTWDDVMYHIYVRQCIDAGLKDADAGRVVDVEEVRRRFGLAP